MTIDRSTGLDIDDEFGVPKEEISCPACGKTYKQARTVCRSCEECKKCCQERGVCDSPDHVPAREFIEEILENI